MRLPFLALAIAVAVLSTGCKPSTASFDAGCNQAFAGPPDGSIVPVCNWTGSCDSVSLQAAIGEAFGDAGVCAQDSDCVFFNDAGPFTYDCYTQEATNPIALTNVPGLLFRVQSLICGYCQKCGGDSGAGPSITVGVPSEQPQNQSCLQCFENQCTSNPIVVDAGQ